jgi:hypothetical protein
MGKTILDGGMELGREIKMGMAGLWLYGSCDFTAKIGRCGVSATYIAMWFVSLSEFYCVLV